MAKKKKTGSSIGRNRPIATTSLPSRSADAGLEGHLDQPNTDFETSIENRTFQSSVGLLPSGSPIVANAQDKDQADTKKTGRSHLAQPTQIVQSDSVQQYHHPDLAISRTPLSPTRGLPTIDDLNEVEPRNARNHSEHDTELSASQCLVQGIEHLSISTGEGWAESSTELSLARTKIVALQDDLDGARRWHKQEMLEMRRKLAAGQERRREDRKSNHHDELGVVRKEKDEVTKKYQESLKELQKALNLAEYNTSSLKQQKMNKKSELQAEKEISSKLLAKIKALEVDCQNKDARFIRLEREVRDVSSYRIRLQKTIDQGREDLEASEASRKSMDKKVEDLRFELETEFHINIDVRRENRALKVEAELQQDNMTLLESQIGGLKGKSNLQTLKIGIHLIDIQKLKTTLESQAGENNKLRNANRALKIKSDSQKHIIASLSRDSQGWKSKLDSQVKSIEYLEDTIQELKEKIESDAPLIEIAKDIRFRHLEQTRDIGSIGPSHRARKAIIDAGNKAAHRCNGIADAALFKAGYVPSESIEDLEAHFSELYQMEPAEFPGDWSPRTVKVVDCIATYKALKLEEENRPEELCATFDDLADKLISQLKEDDFETSEEVEDMLEELEGVIDEIVQTDLSRKRRRGR